MCHLLDVPCCVWLKKRKQYKVVKLVGRGSVINKVNSSGYPFVLENIWIHYLSDHILPVFLKFSSAYNLKAKKLKFWCSIPLNSTDNNEDFLGQKIHSQLTDLALLQGQLGFSTNYLYWLGFTICDIRWGFFVGRPSRKPFKNTSVMSVIMLTSPWDPHPPKLLWQP